MLGEKVPAQEGVVGRVENRKRKGFARVQDQSHGSAVRQDLGQSSAEGQHQRR